MKVEIEVQPWIMQDGDYGDFAVRDTEWFALEFYGRLAPCPPAEPRLHPRGGAVHEVTARVVFRDEEMWMIDFGARAYCDVHVPDGIAAGDWVTGEIHLGIDPFVFRERHAGVPGVPAAIYRWRIARIREHTAPQPPRPLWRSFEETPWTARDVSETDAWNTRPGFDTTYLMECERANEAPVRRVET